MPNQFHTREVLKSDLYLQPSERHFARPQGHPTSRSTFPLQKQNRDCSRLLQPSERHLARPQGRRTSRSTLPQQQQNRDRSRLPQPSEQRLARPQGRPTSRSSLRVQQQKRDRSRSLQPSERRLARPQGRPTSRSSLPRQQQNRDRSRSTRRDRSVSSTSNPSLGSFCPVTSCQRHGQRNRHLKRHLKSHLPPCFSPISWCTIIKTQIMSCLLWMCRKLLGSSGTLKGLMDHLNASDLLTEYTLLDAEIHRCRDFAQTFELESPRKMTTSPLNTPAVLLHPRVTAVALSMLSPSDQLTFYNMFREEAEQRQEGDDGPPHGDFVNGDEVTASKTQQNDFVILDEVKIGEADEPCAAQRLPRC